LIAEADQPGNHEIIAEQKIKLFFREDKKANSFYMFRSSFSLISITHQQGLG
jgi:hypothetical protein